MDGYQVAKAIREEEKGTSRHSTIVALTANAMKGDRELYLSAGMDEYVSKPFTFEILQKAISNVIGQPLEQPV
jgi:CheY-like chemotaxis protein